MGGGETDSSRPKCSGENSDLTSGVKEYGVGKDDSGVGCRTRAWLSVFDLLRLFASLPLGGASSACACSGEDEFALFSRSSSRLLIFLPKSMLDVVR